MFCADVLVSCLRNSLMSVPFKTVLVVLVYTQDELKMSLPVLDGLESASRLKSSGELEGDYYV